MKYVPIHKTVVRGKRAHTTMEAVHSTLESQQEPIKLSFEHLEAEFLVPTVENFVETEQVRNLKDRVKLWIKAEYPPHIVGPTGCGKTTLLRLIAGLELPTEGRILIGEKDVTDLAPKDRDIAMVFQSYALYPNMNVFDNIAYPLKLRKTTKAEITKKVKETANLLRIDDLLDRKPRQLSGGQQQRVALGRSIVRHPNVFLLDEPLSNLDAKLRVHMRAELIRLQKQLGTTLIYVTHDQIEAMSMSERIAILNLGTVQQVAGPKTIFKSPKNLFVAGFIGSPPMNFVEGTLSASGEGLTFSCSCFSHSLEKKVLKTSIKGDRKATLAIRPESILIDCRETPDTLCRAEIYAIEPLGSSTLVDLRIGEDKIWKAVADVDFEADIGSIFFVSISARAQVHLFDENGEALN